MIREESSPYQGTPQAHHPAEKDAVKLRSCYFCLEGWIFIGSIGHDGEEVIESIRCRKCKGKGRIKRL